MLLLLLLLKKHFGDLRVVPSDIKVADNISGKGMLIHSLPSKTF